MARVAAQERQRLEEKREERSEEVSAAGGSRSHTRGGILQCKRGHRLNGRLRTLELQLMMEIN